MPINYGTWEITGKWQNHSFVSNKFVFEKNTIATRLNIFNFFLSVPPFVFAVLFIPSFHVLSSYCISVSLDTQFGGSSHCLIFDEISWHSSFKQQNLNDRAIFVWPWNENGRTKQKQQTYGNRAIWLVYLKDTNARGFFGWLNERSGEKTSCPRTI